MCLRGLVKGSRGHLLKCRITALRISSACSLWSIFLARVWFILYFSGPCCYSLSAHILYIKVWKLFVSCLLQCRPLLLHGSFSVLRVSELESGAERAHHIQQIVVTLPRTIIIVMRYLFAFLNQWVWTDSHYILSHRSCCMQKNLTLNFTYI